MQLSGKIIVFVHEFSYYNEKGVAMQGLRYNTSVSRKELGIWVSTLARMVSAARQM